MSPENHEPEERFELLGPLDESVGPARRISRQRSADLLQGALAGAFAEAAVPEPVPASPSVIPITRGRRAWKGMLVTGTCLALVGSAAAGYWRWGPHTSKPKAAPSAVPASIPSPPEPLAEALPSEEEPVAATPVVQAPRAGPAPVVAEPEDLLRRANERRAAGQWREAEALYQRIQQGAAGTTSAYVAQVASGELRLEHLGDAKGALRQYQQALRSRPRGMLSEEARRGVAEAQRALGDSDKEARALEEFLSAHPDSLFAGTARHRLNALKHVPQ